MEVYLKKLLILFILCMVINLYAEDISATTGVGKKVLLHDDGTWEYAEIEKTTMTGKWNITEKINPIDDSKTITFILIADQGKGSYGDPIVLIIRYMSNETDVFISWGSYLGSEAYVLIRFGSEDAGILEWSLSTTSKATFYPMDSLFFIKKIFNAERLVAQVTPYSESPITAIFDIRGFRKAYEPYKDILKWD